MMLSELVSLLTSHPLYQNGAGSRTHVYVDVGLFQTIREPASVLTVGDDPSSPEPYLLLVARHRIKDG